MNLILQLVLKSFFYVVMIQFCWNPNALLAVEGERWNLLFFGNSFTYYHDMPQMIRQLAVSEGYPAPFMGDATASGQTLAYHRSRVLEHPLTNVDLPDLGGETWDFVIIQASTFDPTEMRDPDLFRENISGLLADVHKAASGQGVGARAVLFQTWAYEPSHNLYQNWFGTPEKYHRALSTSYRLALGDLLDSEGRGAAGLASVGDAYAQLSYDESFYEADKYHPSLKGSVLTALILYRTLYGEKVGDIAYETAGNGLGLDMTTWASLCILADELSLYSPSWHGYARQDDDTVDTGSFLGLLTLSNTDPNWVKSLALDRWIYLPATPASQGSWLWIPQNN